VRVTQLTAGAKLGSHISLGEASHRGNFSTPRYKLESRCCDRNGSTPRPRQPVRAPDAAKQQVRAAKNALEASPKLAKASKKAAKQAKKKVKAARAALKVRARKGAAPKKAARGKKDRAKKDRAKAARPTPANPVRQNRCGNIQANNS